MVIETPYQDRKGVTINVGDTLKWIREDEYFKGGKNKGQLKQAGAEFIAGKVIRLPKDVAEKHDVEFWCSSLENSKTPDPFSWLPGGLRFSSMLEYIEVIQ